MYGPFTSKHSHILPRNYPTSLAHFFALDVSVTFLCQTHVSLVRLEGKHECTTLFRSPEMLYSVQVHTLAVSLQNFYCFSEDSSVFTWHWSLSVSTAEMLAMLRIWPNGQPREENPTFFSSFFLAHLHASVPPPHTTAFAFAPLCLSFGKWKAVWCSKYKQAEQTLCKKKFVIKTNLTKTS